MIKPLRSTFIKASKHLTGKGINRIPGVTRTYQLLYRNLMPKGSPKLFLEFWPQGLRNMNCDPLQLLEELRDLGFSFYCINNKKEVTRTNSEGVIDACESSPTLGKFINLFLEK